MKFCSANGFLLVYLFIYFKHTDFTSSRLLLFAHFWLKFKLVVDSIEFKVNRTRFGITNNLKR